MNQLTRTLVSNLIKSNKISTLNLRYCLIGTSSANASSNIFNIQDEDDFKKRVLENKKPVIVDFHAVWCGPCKILGPRLEKLMSSSEYSQKADFAKVDIDQLSDLAFNYNVNSVPTVISFKNGKKTGQFVGLLDEDRIKNFVATATEK